MSVESPLNNRNVELLLCQRIILPPDACPAEAEILSRLST
jgi:hypothetical protein